MVEIRPTDGAAQFAMRLREIERQLGALSTMRSAQFTKIYDEDGNLLGSLSAAGLEFFNADGGRISSLDGDGLSVYDDNGTAQLRAGDLDGSGDYGVEIGGGRARALDITTGFNLATNVPISTVGVAGASTTIEPPEWSTSTYVLAQLKFQFRNETATAVSQQFRTDINGYVGEGWWSNSVEPGRVQNVADMHGRAVPGNDPILVEGMVSASAGTHTNNAVQITVVAYHFR